VQKYNFSVRFAAAAAAVLLCKQAMRVGHHGN